MAKIASTSLKVIADIGDVKPKMDAVNKALDSVSAAPLESLRDKGEAALDHFNAEVAKTVASLESLKNGLANTGGVNIRELKKTEAALERLRRLGLDDGRAAKIGGVLEEVKVGAGLKDPKLEAREKAIKAELELDQKAAAAKIALEANTNRVLETLRSREAAKLKRDQQAAARDQMAAEARGLNGPSQATIAYEQEAGRRRKFLGDVTGKALNAAGINVPDKAAGALGKVGAWAAAALVAGEAASNVRSDQRDSGVSGGTLRNTFSGLQSLPIIKQLNEGVGNLYALAGSVVGIDTDTTNGRAEADLKNANEAAALYEKYRSRARDAAVEEAKVTRENAMLLRGFASQQAALSIGGKTGQVFAIRTGTDEAINAAAMKRDDVRKAAESEISRIVQEFNGSTSSLRNTASGRAGTAEGDAAQAELNRLAVGKSQAIKTLRDRQTAADAAFEKERAARASLGNRQIGIASGAQENTTAVFDAIADLDRQTRVASGNPFDAMRKSILELKPSAENLEAFSKSLENYKNAIANAEKEGRKFSATKAADRLLGDKSTAGQNSIGAALTNALNEGVPLDKALAIQKRLQDDAGRNALAGAEDRGALIGLGPADAAIRELINSGITDQTILAKIRIQLDASDAKAVASDLRERLASTGDAIRSSLAQTPQDRARAEVEARDRQLRGADGTGVGLTDAQKAQDFEAALDRELAGKAGAVIAATKTPQEKFAQAVDELKEQAARGFLTEEQARRGLGAAIADEANGLRTSRPELLEANTAALDQFVAVSSGAVIDSTNPEIQLAKDSNALLEQIRDRLGGSGRRSTITG